MKQVMIGVFGLSLVLLGAQGLYSQCTCAFVNGIRNGGVDEEFQRSKAVFIGEVIGIKHIPSVSRTKYLEFEITFRVHIAWKTDLPDTLLVRNVSGNVADFKEKESYLVYATVDHDNILRAYIGCCTRTGRLSDATEDLKTFESRGLKPTKVIKSITPISLSNSYEKIAVVKLA